MAGLKRIAKMYGGVEINGVKFVYDYARDECVPESEMPPGSDRMKESERAKWRQHANAMADDSRASC